MGQSMKWRTEDEFKKAVLRYIAQCQINRFEKVGQGSGVQELQDIETRNGNCQTLYTEIPTTSGLALFTDTARSILIKYFRRYPDVHDLFNDFRTRAAVTNLTSKETAAGAQTYINRYLIPDDEREADSELRRLRVQKAHLELDIKRLQKQILEKELNGTQQSEEMTALKKLLAGLQ